MKVRTIKGYDTVLLISVNSADKLAEWASGATAVSKIVPGLGDAAYAGPINKSGDASVIAFRKGARAVRIASSLATTDNRHVSEERLMELATLMESRMP